MGRIRTVGLPKIHNVPGEKRAFLPGFVELLNQYDVDIYLEYGYGKEMGIEEEAYRAVSERIHFVSKEDAYKQDFVIILKAPDVEELENMKAGSGLMSMLHYESRPGLVNKLKTKGIYGYSMDAVADDENNRMVVSYELTALGGVRTAFQEMAKRRKDFFSKDRVPFRVTIIGMGNLGIQAGKACMELGDASLLERLRNEEASGVMVQYLGKDITMYHDALKPIFSETDLLVDATRRWDFSQIIIPNERLQYLKEEAIILDLTVDPYDTSVKPIQVKGIEGLPTGNLKKYVFEKDAEEYEQIPKEVSTKYRRVTVSCSGWPGVLPMESMAVYEKQLWPFIKIVLTKGHNIRIESSNLHERALYRGTLAHFEKEHQELLFV
ncbi:MAG: alanine dehydrogenase [Bacillota bacterium]